MTKKAFPKKLAVGVFVLCFNDEIKKEEASAEITAWPKPGF